MSLNHFRQERGSGGSANGIIHNNQQHYESIWSTLVKLDMVTSDFFMFYHEKEFIIETIYLYS